MSTAEIIAELPKLSSSELAEVEAKLKELSTQDHSTSATTTLVHPALGMWRDRKDLPEDSALASKVLRERMMRSTEDSNS